MVGQKIGNYTIVRKIGDGGMGSVYEAVHESIGRHVAVKVLRPLYSKDPQIVARFFNEACAVNLVTHPGIVSSIDYGQLADGTAYIVMEYVDGESLGARIKRIDGPFGHDALRIARQIAATLAAAHAKGIIHRDLKPDNVIIVADSEAPGGERAKVLDFGIAKLVGEAKQGKNQDVLTQAGAIMGTPRYMAPEQCREAAHVDPKADVYSLGVILFEMLAGQPPFIGESNGALMAMHIYQTPPPLRRLESSVPPAAEALVNAMLAKEPAARPSMKEVVAQIEQLGATATGIMPALRRSANLQAVPTPISGEGSGNNSSRPSLAGVGQTQDPTRLELRRQRRRRLAIIATLATALSAAGTLFVLNRDRDTRPVAARLPAAEVKKVVCQVTSAPAGVEVVRIVDNVGLGVTPWRSEQPAGAGKLGLTLRRAGYMDKQVILDRDKDCSEHVSLEPVPAANAANSSANSDSQAGSVQRDKRPGRSNKSTKHSKDANDPKENEDVELAPVH